LKKVGKMIKKLNDLNTPMSPVYRCKRCGDIFTDGSYFVKSGENAGVPQKVAHICNVYVFEEDNSEYKEIGIAELVGYDEV